MSDEKTVGRPKKELTEQEKGKVEAYAERMTAAQIADKLGIGRSTFYEIMRRDDTISGLYKKGKANGIHKVAGKLMDRIDANDVTSIIFYLKTQAGWSEKNIIDHISSDNSMNPTEIHLLTPDFEDDDSNDT